METEELGIWYKENKDWLKKKARYFISSSLWGFENVDELVSITLEELLYNRQKLRIETLKEYTFFVMRSCFYTVFVNKRQIKNTHYDEVLDEMYQCFEESYDFKRDVIEEKRLNIIYHRITNEDDLRVIEYLKKGNFNKKTKRPLKDTKYYYILEKLRGNTQYKPVVNKKPKAYKGIAKILDGKIVKVYPDYASVKKDGYSTSRVNQICKGRIKTNIYRKFEWKYITE